MQEYRAQAGSVIVIDVDTGEVLAMVNQPAYNPNDRDQVKPGMYRNRAATDIFEPGSSIKPLIMAAALSSGQYRADSVVDTSPGFLKVGTKVFEDETNLGTVDLATILAKSSNVGTAKVALSLKPEQIWKTLTGLGLGQVTGSGYPGESAGMLSSYAHWRPIGIATLSHGYGLSVTPLQLAHAYATIGAGGIRRPLTFERVSVNHVRSCPIRHSMTVVIGVRTTTRSDDGRHQNAVACRHGVTITLIASGNVSASPRVRSKSPKTSASATSIASVTSCVLPPGKKRPSEPRGPPEWATTSRSPVPWMPRSRMSVAALCTMRARAGDRQRLAAGSFVMASE